MVHNQYLIPSKINGYIEDDGGTKYVTIAPHIRSIFKNRDVFIPQTGLEKCLYELAK